MRKLSIRRRSCTSKSLSFNLYHYTDGRSSSAGFTKSHIRTCAVLSNVVIDLWSAEGSNCRFQFTKLADASMMSLGDLLFSILDKEEVKDSEDSWEGVLKHGAYQRQSDDRTPCLISCV
jgi:hypothetical protein